MISVEIEYLVKDSVCPIIMRLTPQEYFEPVEEWESFENEAIPRYSLENEYLQVSIEQLMWTKLSISGTSEDKVIITNYHNNGDTLMIHRKDISGYEEIIHRTRIEKNETYIIRTHKEHEKDYWKVSTNNVIYDLDNGKQTEISFL
jgi:hypothetical protein